jgi:5,10-methylenetetrahydromethanopterin reductase
MKIGVSLGVSHREPISHTVEVVQSAERLDFDSAWIADVQLSMKDAYVSLALCAANTSAIKLGTGVTNPVTRHPTTIANGFTALNEVSNGRAVIGIGTGWTGVYSIGLKPAKIADLEAAINSMHTLCEGGEVEGVDGQPYRLVTATGRIPVFVAANQPRILAMCGRVADGVILMGGANEEFTRWQIDHVRRGAEEVGRDINEIQFHLWANIGMSDDLDQARDDVSHWAASQAETFSKWKHLPDFMLPFQEDFQRASDNYDRLEHMSSHAEHKHSVSPEFIDWVALTGTPGACLEQIKALEPLGVHGVTLSFRAGAGGRQARMEMIQQEIIRHVS